MTCVIPWGVRVEAHKHGTSSQPYAHRPHRAPPGQPPRARTFKGWVVKLKGRFVDLVYFGPTMDQDEIRDSLIHHDNYDPRISVELA